MSNLKMRLLYHHIKFKKRKQDGILLMRPEFVPQWNILFSANALQTEDIGCIAKKERKN